MFETYVGTIHEMLERDRVIYGFYLDDRDEQNAFFPSRSKMK